MFVFKSTPRNNLELRNSCRNLVRLLATQVQLAENIQHYEELRPYSALPGPTSRQLFTSFLPGGQFYDKSIVDFAVLMRKQYGDIFLMRGMFGRPDMLTTFNTADIEKIFRNEGQWPVRQSFDQILHFRQQIKPDFFSEVQGVIAAQGESWYKLRSILNPVLMKPNTMKIYLKPLLKVNQEFVKRISEIRNPQTLEVPTNFDQEINRVVFEMISIVALNKEFGLIRQNRDNPEALKLFANVRKLFTLFYQLDVEPSMWKTIPTPKYYESMRVQTEIFETASKYVNEALAVHERNRQSDTIVKDAENQSVLEKLVNIDRKIAIVMAMDILMAGFDATSASMAGILLALAKHPEKQQKLREELMKILPQKDSPLTEENMKNLPYLRAVIKEGMRFYPNGPGTFRNSTVDMDLSGFKIPAGTNILLTFNLLTKDEQYYTKPQEFIPERWLRNSKDKKDTFNPFTFMPFGFGPRICIGKRIVDLQMEIIFATLVRNYYIEFNYPADKPFRAYLSNVPQIPLTFKFSDVEI